MVLLFPTSTSEKLYYKPMQGQAKLQNNKSKLQKIREAIKLRFLQVRTNLNQRKNELEEADTRTKKAAT